MFTMEGGTPPRARRRSIEAGVNGISNRVVLTADRTLMSSYNGSMFVGFAACFPRVLPKWLYTKLFCPAQQTRRGVVQAAPAGLRKIQAALVNSGIPASEIAVAHPDKIQNIIDSTTRVIGITTSDPMGLGPASSTFSSLLEKESYTAYFFRKLVTNPALRASGAKVIVGGPGAWQLQNESVRKSYQIDCLVEGEGEQVAPQLFRDVLEGRELPNYVTGTTVPVDKIPLITEPTINGTVEISRGCGRGCEFCNPNMRTVRHVSAERIMKEIEINVAYKKRVTLHAEDVLRYKAKGMVPDKDAVLSLFRGAYKLTDDVGISHLALSSALAEPKLIEELGQLNYEMTKQRYIYGQTGIETGSPDLVSKHMKGKAKPFAPERWSEVVRESFKLLQDNNWVVCGTLVMGMPGERREDVQKTLELIQDLREYKSLIVPLFFVPLGDLKASEFFRPSSMLQEHWMLLAECIDHDFNWAPKLMEELFAQDRMSTTKAGGFKIASWYMQRRLKPALEAMREGKDPRDKVTGWFGTDAFAKDGQMGSAEA